VALALRGTGRGRKIVRKRRRERSGERRIKNGKRWKKFSHFHSISIS